MVISAVTNSTIASAINVTANLEFEAAGNLFSDEKLKVKYPIFQR